MELNNGKVRLKLNPEIGGSITECSINRGGEWIPILRPIEEPLNRSSDAASFVLIPYSNRLRDAKFFFQGKEYQLRGREKHAIHGDVRDRALQIINHSGDRVSLGFDSIKAGDVNFPFPFFAKMTYALEDYTLTSRIELQNVGSGPMPAGCGFHPYFNRRLEGSTGEVELQLTVNGVYPGNTPLPSGPATPLQPEHDFHVRRPLDVVLDHCFAGWNGQALIDWPGSGVQAFIQADASMKHVILYSPPYKRFFALEPVTNANDGFNLYAQGDLNCGVVVLQKGEILQAGFSMSLQI
ncbi:aldose 1-epimerase [Candidatus Nitronereus thalassa]|uniref:Aldose 1-epimerase n=1 Tax=Candidatus Nitronereus thalassa TaxID=3020898 RepID=A0ABU3KCI2_9BACT|nr:aldose 1-epimerase [Candidatus Nitronereus thalassa]MDT7044130.1 aldose 1-epimerase [Candidatus Nitronereus thalassa]